MQLLTYTAYCQADRLECPWIRRPRTPRSLANMWVYKILASLGFSIFQDAVRRQAKAWYLEDIQASCRLYGTDSPRLRLHGLCVNVSTQNGLAKLVTQPA